MFSAQCTNGGYANQFLSFHSFLVNIGNDFDLSSGTFTTPITGIYELSLFGSIDHKSTFDSVNMKIMKNNEEVFSILNYVDSSDSDDFISGSTWLLPLHKGDKVRIYISKGNIACGVDFPGIFNGKYLGPM